MRREFSRFIPLLAAALSGCAIHPLAEDVTRDKTLVIVNRIRCEARDAAFDKLVAYLTGRDGYPETVRFGQTIGRDRALPADYARRIDKDSLSYIEKYGKTAIAYEFTLDIAEQNNNTLSINALNPFGSNKATAGLGATLNLSRENNRTFRIVDDFKELIIDNKPGCPAYANSTGNYLYPITGNIGLAEMVNTFIDLNEKANLASKTAQGDSTGKVPTLTDQLDFQTVISGALSPKITLSPAAHGFSFTDIGLQNNISRTDKHRVVVALSLPVDVVENGKKKQLPAKDGALNAIDKQKQNFVNDSINRIVNLPALAY